MDGTLKSMRGRAEPVTVKESRTRREQRHRLPLAAWRSGTHGELRNGFCSKLMKLHRLCKGLEK